MAIDPIKKVKAVTGRYFISPPSLSISRVSVALITEPAPKKRSPLKKAWLSTCNSPPAKPTKASIKQIPARVGLEFRLKSTKSRELPLFPIRKKK